MTYKPEETEPFLKIPLSVLKRLRKLRYSTQILYCLFLEQVQWIPGVKPRRPQRGKEIFECTASLARKECGISGNTYSKGVKEMIEHGFIRVHLKGNFPNDTTPKTTSRYRLLIY